METAEELEHDAFGGEHDVDWRPERPKAGTNRYWIVIAVLAVALGTGAFIGMRAAANNSAPAAPTGAPGPGGGPPGFQRGDGAFGRLQSVNGSTLTLQTPDGDTVKVTTTSSTQITKVTNGTAQSSSLSALTVGQPVMVQGTTGSDGTVAADSIRQGGGPRGGRGDGDSGPPPNDDQQQQQQQQNVTS